LILIVALEYYPVLAGFYYAFFDWDGFSTPTFIGLGNFLKFPVDKVLLGSFGNMARLTIVHVAISLTAPLLAAKLIASLRQERFRYLYRVVFVIPMVVPWIVYVLIWQFMYLGEIGVINGVLRAVGFGDLARAWLSDPNTALYAVALMGFPWISGINFLIYYAGLIGIPRELIEAGRIDGATGLQVFRRIELPLVLGQIKLVVILSFIGWIQNYATILVMTGGGPFQTTMVPGLWMYLNAFQFQQWGYGCAIGVTLFVIIFTLTWINNRFIKSSVEYEAK
jgi:raffinose/stachyose/melibiose transport system permease protein